MRMRVDETGKDGPLDHRLIGRSLHRLIGLVHRTVHGDDLAAFYLDPPIPNGWL